MTAWETVGMSQTTPGTLGTFGASAGLSGQSATVRNTALNGKIQLEATWIEAAAASITRIRSPRLHDNVQGIRYSVPLAIPYNLLGYRPETPLVPQDTSRRSIYGRRCCNRARLADQLRKFAG